MKRQTSTVLLSIALLAGCGLLPKTAPAQVGSVTGNGVQTQSIDTNVLNKDALLAGEDGQQWFKDNVPFLEVPDANIQKIYYYRMGVLRRQIKYTRPETGYVFTEFLNNVGYAGIYGGIAVNIWHNNLDARWLRNRQFLDDDDRHWASGLGLDRQYQYSNDLAAAVWQRYLITGDAAFTTGLLNPLITHLNGWAQQRLENPSDPNSNIKTGFDAGAGLYYANPDTEATENTLMSLQTRDAYKWGWGYRPSINAFMYGDLRALANISRLAGNGGAASDFDNRANTLKANVQQKLWDPQNKFFYQVMRDNARQEYGQHPNGGARNPNLPIIPEGTRGDARELANYLPWMFGLPDDTADFSQAWRQIVDPNGFDTTWGPASAERRHRLFESGHAQCCFWNGPAWPFATSQALEGMGNLLHDYRNNTAVNKNDYYRVLKKYTDLQFKDGHPYVAEAADSVTGRWIYDGANHSEHYNHSSYVNLIISGLIGVRPKADTTVDVNPLVPDGWDYFALENVPYHGHTLTILWDRTGSRYGRGQGLGVFVDGTRRGWRGDLGKLTVDVGPTLAQPSSRYVNLAANPVGDVDRPLYEWPKASASFTSPNDNPLRAIDGQTLFDGANLAPNSRWTNYGSPNTSDYLEVDLGKDYTFNQIRVSFYDDTGTGSVRTPASYRVQYMLNGQFYDIPNQQRIPASPARNDVNVINFSSIVAPRIRVVATKQGGFAFGITEVEVANQTGGAGLGLPKGSWNSFQVTTPGFTNRFLRHQNSLGFTEVVTADSPALLKQDASWRLVNALDGTGCYSFESRNFPGKFLRHQGGRLRLDSNDGSAQMHQDATFCAQTGLSGTGVSWASRNFPNSYLRHRNGEVWLDAGDTSLSFKQDASWEMSAAWAP